MKIHTFAVGLLTAAMAVQVVPNHVWGLELPSPAGANAADLYRQAFDAIDKSAVAKSPVFQNDIKTTPLTDETKSLLESNKEVIGLVRRGATAPSADWGDVSDMTKVMAELNRARTASHLMLLQTRTDLQNKQADAAVDGWLATITLARRVGDMDLLVTRLVSIAIESEAIDHATAEIPNLPDSARQHFAAGYAKLPPPPTGRAMIEGEFAYAKKAIVKQNVNQDWVTILEPFYKAIADAADGPTDAFGNVVDEQMVKFKLNPFAQTLGPSLKRAHTNMSKIQEKRAALETALRAEK
jgi:hypothetical protein